MPLNVSDITAQIGQLSTSGVQALSQPFQETPYAFQSFNFPSDIGTEQNAHHIKIMAFTGGTSSSGGLGYNPPTQNRMTARIFIPGSQANENMPLIYEQQHNFTDIRLTNIINDSLLGVGVALSTRRMLSPMVQILYRSTNLRQFDFGFLMCPRNLSEAQQIEGLQRSLRAYAAPEINGAVMIAPAEFEFHFYRGNQINPHIPRIARCVITRPSINYGPTGIFSAFKDGYPKTALLTFSATEIRVIDRNLILQGDGSSQYGSLGF